VTTQLQFINIIINCRYFVIWTFIHILFINVRPHVIYIPEFNSSSFFYNDNCPFLPGLYRFVIWFLTRIKWMCNTWRQLRKTVLFECLAEYFRAKAFRCRRWNLLSWRVQLSLVRDCTHHGKLLTGLLLFAIPKSRSFQCRKIIYVCRLRFMAKHL